MHIERVHLKERSYDICVGYDLSRIGETLLENNFGRRVLIITNPTVCKLYGKKVDESIKKAGFHTRLVEIPDGEEYKSIEQAVYLYNECIDFMMDRSCPVVALGGGVIGDLAGFVAATYMRGVPLIQVPTTLLAQVDSSVGGKVAVNLPSAKNMVGAFYQPTLVYIDLDVLKTLSQDNYTIGLAEVIKYGIISDKTFFEFVEKNIDRIKNRDIDMLSHIVSVSCRIKAHVVGKDERESDLRAILNFGHTIGHALEVLGNYTLYQHGEAVSVGMICAARIAGQLGMLDSKSISRIENVINEAGLPLRIHDSIAPEKIIAALSMDKKVKDDKICFVLPVEIGKVTVRNDIDKKIIKGVLKSAKN